MWECVYVCVWVRFAFLALGQQFYLVEKHFNTFCFWQSYVRAKSSHLSLPSLPPSLLLLLHALLPSSRLCTSAKVISSIDSYHQLFNWSITPAPHLLNASLINYCPPQGWEWGGCQREFSRLRWIFIVFVPRSVRAHQLVLKHAEFRGPKVGWVPLYWYQMCTQGCIPYILYIWYGLQQLLVYFFFHWL